MIIKKFILRGLQILEIRGYSDMDMRFNEIFKNRGNELLEKSKNMEKISDIAELDKPLAKILENTGKYDNIENDAEKLAPNLKYEIDGDIYETDDNGNTFKKNGELFQNTIYEVNKITYTTDDMGKPESWECKPELNPDNERDEKAQRNAGGADKKEGDQGGHLVARILNGPSGNENIVAMRGTINQGDYKKSENEIVDALKQGKDVKDSGKIFYEGNSARPDKIERTYVIDGEKNVFKFDNVEGSKDLLEDIKGSISDENMEMLNNEIEDTEKDGGNICVTSVLKKYDKDNNIVSVRVGIIDETTGEKTYKVYTI